MTDDEKRQARATDRARRADHRPRRGALRPSALARMHGAARDIVARRDDAARDESCALGSQGPPARPTRRTDAQDLLYAGHDRDRRRDPPRRRRHASSSRVTIDDDPAAELHDWYGRYHYYRIDEVERPMTAASSSPASATCSSATTASASRSRRARCTRRRRASTVADYGIRALHLAFELLSPYRLCIVADCMPRGGAPGTLYVLEPDLDGSNAALPDAHGIDLSIVLEPCASSAGPCRGWSSSVASPRPSSRACSSAHSVEAAVPGAIELIRELIQNEPQRSP